MSDMNMVMLYGRLGKDPQLKETKTGNSMVKFSLATTHRTVGKNGVPGEEKTQWHNIVTWGKQAESCVRYLKKGNTVFVRGSIRTTTWDDKDGKTRYWTEVAADQVTFGSNARAVAATAAQPEARPDAAAGPDATVPPPEERKALSQAS